MSTTHGHLWIVSAPSGGGKTSLSRALLPRLAALGVHAQISVSHTTRAPRAGEVDGSHYHFIDETRFVERIAANAFLEHAHVFGRRYGTARAETEALLATGRDVVLDIDWQGARQVRAAVPEAKSVFILPPSRLELERRLRGRGTDADSVIAERMALARDEMSHFAEYESLVVNEDFETALQQLIALFLAPRLALQHQQARYGTLIAELLEN
ncbi:MAG: guanylate kinase [Pseudomonadota bacterium]